MSDVDTLRRAVEKLRKVAAEARKQGGDLPWIARPAIDPDNNGWVVELDIDADGWDATIARLPYDYEGAEVAPYIATMHPGVALAVADWLKTCVVIAESDAQHAMKMAVTHGSLAVARAILGEAS